jgi:hypothetical protein
MGVPPMKHGQDARATPASEGFRENLQTKAEPCLFAYLVCFGVE